MAALIAVEFLAPYVERAGAQFNRGERAGFPRAVAEELAARGIVRLLLPEPEERAPEGPSVDKMIRGKERKGRFL